jgi:hypothetical protein
MLVLRFSVHIKLKLKGKCPKHPRFNPELGRGAIRGGCSECMALYEVVAARDRAPPLPCGSSKSSRHRTEFSESCAPVKDRVLYEVKNVREPALARRAHWSGD